MRERGLKVAVAAAPGLDLSAVAAEQGVEVHPVPIEREIAPAADARALVSLYRLMRRWRPDVVNAGTPKAGLLGMLAARAARVPVRIYVLRGLRLETAIGRRRRLLRATERTAAACAHRVLAVSQSLADRGVELRLCPPHKITTLGSGSSNGVEVSRFADRSPEKAARLRADLGIPPDAPVIGFVGRFTRDKGIVELVQAFALVRAEIPQTRLLLVGEFEPGDPVPEPIAEQVRSDASIVLPGFVPDTAAYYGVMDVLAFPSRREGFPNAPLEAAAAARPVAAFRATGTVDAVVDGVTGTLVEAGDVRALAEAITRYLTDFGLRHRHGQAGQHRARAEFAPERIWQALLEEYEKQLRTAAASKNARFGNRPRDRE